MDASQYSKIKYRKPLFFSSSYSSVHVFPCLEFRSECNQALYTSAGHGGEIRRDHSSPDPPRSHERSSSKRRVIVLLSFHSSTSVSFLFISLLLSSPLLCSSFLLLVSPLLISDSVPLLIEYCTRGRVVAMDLFHSSARKCNADCRNLYAR